MPKDNEDYTCQLQDILSTAETYFPKRLSPIDNRSAYQETAEYQKLLAFKFEQLSLITRNCSKFFLALNQSSALARFGIEENSDPRTEHCLLINFWKRGQDPQNYIVITLLISYIGPYYCLYQARYDFAEKLTKKITYKGEEINFIQDEMTALKQIIREKLGSHYTQLQEAILEEIVPDIVLYYGVLNKLTVFEFLFKPKEFQ